MYGSIAILGILCLPVLLMPYRWNVGLVRWWTGLVLGAFERLIGVRTVIKGEENLPQGNYFVALKHQAMWETLMVNRIFDNPAIVLKQELMWVPLFGWWAWKLRMISIDRGAHAKALRKMLAEAKRECEAGRKIVIFPQGTRTPPGVKNPYKPGVAAIYKTLDVPVVPVALTSGLCWPKKGYGYKPGTITVEFLPPIEPGLPRSEFMAELETRIETATDRLIAEAGGTAA
jgi:1-acyl-sn-glycerol-3-phosphate acyltransferase